MAMILRRALLALIFSASAFAGGPCDTPPLQTFEPQACVLNTARLERFYEECVKPQDLMNSENLFASLVRVSQAIFLMKRDADLLARISPSHPQFDQLWQDFETRWNEAYSKDEALSRADFSYAVAPPLRGEMEHLVLGVKEMQAMSVTALREDKGRDAQPLDTGYDLLKMGLALYAVQSSYAQDLKKGPYAERAVDDFQALESYAYERYPELKVDEDFYSSIKLILGQFVSRSDSAFAREIFAPLEEGKELDIALILKKFEEVIALKVAPKPFGRQVVAGLERQFVKVMAGFRYAMLSSIAEGKDDSSVLYSRPALVLFAAARLDRTAGAWYPSVLGSIFCAKTLGFKKWEERWESVKSWAGGASALSMVAATVLAVATKGRVENPELVREIVLDMIRGSFTVGTALAVGDYAYRYKQYRDALEEFYWGLTDAEALQGAADQKSKAAYTGATTVFLLSSGIAAARLQPLVAAAESIELPGEITLSARALSRTLNGASLGVFAHSTVRHIGEDIEKRNWFGLGFQLAALSMPVALGQALAQPPGQR